MPSERKFPMLIPIVAVLALILGLGGLLVIRTAEKVARYAADARIGTAIRGCESGWHTIWPAEPARAKSAWSISCSPTVPGFAR